MHVHTQLCVCIHIDIISVHTYRYYICTYIKKTCIHTHTHTHIHAMCILPQFAYMYIRLVATATCNKIFIIYALRDIHTQSKAHILAQIARMLANVVKYLDLPTHFLLYKSNLVAWVRIPKYWVHVPQVPSTHWRAS